MILPFPPMPSLCTVLYYTCCVLFYTILSNHYMYVYILTHNIAKGNWDSQALGSKSSKPFRALSMGIRIWTLGPFMWILGTRRRTHRAHGR